MHLFLKILSRLANSVASMTAPKEQSHLGQHCLQMHILLEILVYKILGHLLKYSTTTSGCGGKSCMVK